MPIPTILKTVVPFKAQAPADRDTAWSASAATKRGAKWAGGPDADKMDWGKYRSLFVRYDADKADTLGGYHGPHTDIIGGEAKTIFKGCAALAVVLAGGRGGMAIPDGEVAGVKAHVAKHYHQFKDDNGDPEKAPWEREKDFTWLPEEKRAAARLKIDLTEARKAIEADAAALALAAAASQTGDTNMSDRILIIRNDADVSEDIEAPADGVFEEDVAAVSTDGGETWLELGGDHRVKDETATPPAAASEGEDGEADAEAEAAAEAERVRLAEEEATAAAAAQAEVDAAAQAQADADAAAAAEAEAAKGATPTKYTLDHSLLGELAETGFLRFFWNLTYALGDVLCGILSDDDNDGDEAPDQKQTLADKALADFNDLARQGFTEALALTAQEPEREDPFAGMSYGEVIHSILAAGDPDGAALDPEAEASEDTTTQVTALQAQVTELETKGTTDSKALAEAAALIEELLDMPLERKIGSDEDADAVVDINEKYPWLDPSLRRKLATRAK